MRREENWEVTVPLSKIPAAEIALTSKDEYYKIIHDAYTSKCLEAIGVEPTERYKRMLAKHSPLDECNIEATWGDNSVMCSSLRITQPIIEKQREVIQVQQTQKDQGSDALLRELERRGRQQMMSVVPPAVSLPSERQDPKKTQALGEREAEQQREAAFMMMNMSDLKASEGADAVLTDDLERVRRKARKGVQEEEDEEPTLVQWGEEGQRELAKLQKKFILPFAAEKKSRHHAGGTVMIPWQSQDLQADCKLDVKSDHVEEASQPVCVTLEAIYAEQSKYIYDHLPLELLTTRKDPWLFHLLRKRLLSPEAIRLVGLLAHTLYWSVLGHLHPPHKRLPKSTSQSLGLTLQELWTRLVEPIKKTVGRRGELLGNDSPAGICFVLPVFMLSIKRAVEYIFLTQYRQMFADPDFGETTLDKLVTQMNIMLMNIFDPDCAYANFGGLDGSLEAIKKWKKLHTLQMKMGLTTANRMLSREFRTTPMVMLLLNSDGSDPIDPKTRRHLQKSSSDSVLAAVSGVLPTERIEGERQRALKMGVGGFSPPMPRPHLDQAKRSALYRTAKQRFTFMDSGKEVVGMSSTQKIGSTTPKAGSKVRP